MFDASPKKMLHIAPEAAFQQRFKQIPHLDYLTADLNDPRCAVKMDITNIQYPDNTFDIIYCSHVLEHVPDDRKALREFVRVLKPEGWAVLMVPILVERTIEDPCVTSPAERERRFGQHDHVRCYGPDFRERLEQEGFDVTVTHAAELAAREEISPMGLPEYDAVFFARKVEWSIAVGA